MSLLRRLSYSLFKSCTNCTTTVHHTQANFNQLALLRLYSSSSRPSPQPSNKFHAAALEVCSNQDTTMTVVATKFTPEVLLSAPRRSVGSPNCKGEKVLFTVSTYSFSDHRKTSSIRVLDVKSGQSTVLFEDSTFSEPTWVSEHEFIFIKSGDNGTSTLMLSSVKHPNKRPKEIFTTRGSISSLKVKPLSKSAVLLACAALATPDGKMYNAEKDDAKVHHTGKVYTELFVRHWDSYITKNKNAIWFGRLKWSSQPSADDFSASLTLDGSGLTNVLAGSGLESPVPPFGGSGDFDLSPHGIAFVARDLDVNPATHTKSSVYFVPVDFNSAQSPAPSSAPKAIPTPGLQGYSAGPAFGPDGKSLAFTRMRHIQYESDKPRLMLAKDVVGDTGADAQEFFATEDGEGGWDLRPEGPIWSADGKELYVVAEDAGYGKLFKFPSDPEKTKMQKLGGDGVPEALTLTGTVGDVKVLKNEDGSSRLFVSSSSMVDSSYFNFLDPSTSKSELVSSLSKNGKVFGLSRSQLDGIWFKGAGDYQCHAQVVRPSDFDSSKRYPLAFLIHGGPQGAWNDNWSTRWSPAIFAEQGYVVVAPNPTGSTGYGMALQNGIKNEWGGRPYNDLVKCFEYIANNMPYVDMDRAVALGASYGGFMINWIQGHPLGRKFKALVCHDGVFSTLNQYASEELFFPLHDFGGTLWENREGYEKWDPAKFTGEWATPQLIIHNELDYRLTIGEGLSAFNVLQSRGVPSRFLMFPDENHWVLKPENSLLWHQEVLGWINKYSGVDDSGLAEKAADVKI
ncbi:uncharacterized protein PgNI_08797 [Pyricularia grisea]|uniref:Dipeptidyl-peptidase V n=1 Tax=Pyricularia grisea TaxID=148305 RepID=A0A6P8AWJ4_PYRGI|nr:uncharacterized protein PgNI_08797 [Pyricularia grisea]TLD06570.1 hypothetical protein PgNI_08797 [Pyricularia grisea]